MSSEYKKIQKNTFRFHKNKKIRKQVTQKKVKIQRVKLEFQKFHEKFQNITGKNEKERKVILHLCESPRHNSDICV